MAKLQAGITGPVMLPPNSTVVLFDENGVSEEIDDETALATADGVPGYALIVEEESKKGKGRRSPVVAEGAAPSEETPPTEETPPVPPGPPTAEGTYIPGPDNQTPGG